MKNFFFMTLSASFLIIGCGNQTSSPGVTDNEILIGNIQDLSGPIKELGALIPAGSQMYFDYINEFDQFAFR